MNKFQAGTILTCQVMDYQVYSIVNASSKNGTLDAFILFEIIELGKFRNNYIFAYYTDILGIFINITAYFRAV